MKEVARKYELDMCNGPLLPKILQFSIPLILSGILQLLYNAVNIIVVGRFVGRDALAAVGATSSLVNLIITLFMGLSIGASIVMAKYYGAGQLKLANKTVHTSIAISAVGGLVLGIFGILMARLLLKAVNTPEDVIAYAVTYMKIYFLGMPASLIFNFGSAILRAVGDTRRPLYYLTISGILNLALNLLFVLVFHMSVDGVAAATVISQYLSMILILLCLIRSEGCIQLRWREIRFHKNQLMAIIKIGLPAGIQGSMFAISNVQIQSSINSLGSTIMAGDTAALNIEGFIFMAMSAFSQTVTTFTGQNVGARKYHRVGRILGLCLLSVAVLGVTLSGLSLLFSGKLLSLYTTDPNVIAIGKIRMTYILTFYLVCGMMDVLGGSIRGLGYSLLPMISSIIGVVGIRVTWVFTVFPMYKTLQSLYVSYPVSWTITALVNLCCFMVLRRRLSWGDSDEK